MSWTCAGQPDVCLIEADTIAVSANVRVTGTRPLVLVATTSIDIAATLDVASHGLSQPGPGAGSTPCAGIDGANGMGMPIVTGGAGAAVRSIRPAVTAARRKRCRAPPALPS